MAGINNFETFAVAIGANVMDQAAYAAAAFRQSGFEPGIAQSEQLNKVWRQSSFMSAVLAQFMADQTGSDVLDDGDLASKIAILVSAMQITAGIRPARLVTVSTSLVVLTSDSRIGLNRTVGVAAMTSALPAGAQVGQSFTIEDVVGNLNASPNVVSPPGGHSICGLASYKMNEDRQSSTFTYYGSNIWSVS